MANGKAIQFLIVDDDAEDRELFIDAVARVDKNITCLQAVNGYEAFKLLGQEEIIADCIFLDLNMPKMGGKQFLKSIKLNGDLQSIPIIIYSTSKLESDKEETLRGGASYFITKPTKLSDLTDYIQFVLAKFLNSNLDNV